MGTTFTCKRIASAFENDAGEVIYVLNEVAYESNVRPHRKSVSTVYVGDLRGAMRCIFYWASATEGGILNSPDRKMTPERYIKSWLNALKNPFVYDKNTPINIEYGYSWNEDAREKLVRIVDEKGLPATLGNYYRDVSLLDAYFAVNHPFSHDGKPLIELEQSRKLGYHPSLADDEPKRALDHTVLRFNGSWDDKYVLMNDIGLTMNAAASMYVVVETFVSELWSEELKRPGCYRYEIPAFRTRLKHAEVNNNLRCRLRSIAGPCPEETIEEVRAKYGNGFNLGAVDPGDLHKVISAVGNYQPAA
ncbi:hypothetical protein B1757_13735 [Acidithiobacillus marinus]|uniref:Uncharacterized protein n=1 Tax=Acidithiobacillus marinus TaxID=187490 RepID=A0A2I1DIF9_9PROT|nr:hypothetical protein [Acidithiobacillus marinus]PKY09659.1 hypothetical protein B1757_13735 [Acidithiobacillus marinus]